MKYNSPNFKNGRFRNLVPTSVYSENHSPIRYILKFLFLKHKEASPKRNLPAKRINFDLLNNLKLQEVAITWFGHSTVLISSKNLNILADPVFKKGNFSFFNIWPKTFFHSEAYSIENLPKIDIVLISHDHLDHLDKGMVIKLKNSKFYVPLGVRAYLLKWGISEKNVKEFNWYDEQNVLANLKLVFTPARHYSMRKLFDRDKTLWGSWVIKLSGKTIYFSGDTGYFKEFEKIGKKYGPFDIAMLDAGQYNIAWQGIHMLPEEAIQAAIDLKAKSVLTIHHSKFVLSLHSWYDPLDSITALAEKSKVNIVTPRIGETFILGRDMPNNRWWAEIR